MAGETGGREDPLIGFNFGLEIQGSVKGYFTEVSGIGSEHEIIEHKVVDTKGHEITRKIPGRLKWGDITLKRGITSVLDVWEWREQVEQGDVAGARKNGSITMLDRNYTEVARWNFEMAWPSKVTGPALKSDSNDFGIEEMVIVHEGIKRVQ
jgi:phage tail-like protein